MALTTAVLQPDADSNVTSPNAQCKVESVGERVAMASAFIIASRAQLDANTAVAKCKAEIIKIIDYSESESCPWFFDRPNTFCFSTKVLNLLTRM